MFDPNLFYQVAGLEQNSRNRKVVKIPTKLTGISFKIINDPMVQFTSTFVSLNVELDGREHLISSYRMINLDLPQEVRDLKTSSHSSKGFSFIINEDRRLSVKFIGRAEYIILGRITSDYITLEMNCTTKFKIEDTLSHLPESPWKLFEIEMQEYFRQKNAREKSEKKNEEFMLRCTYIEGFQKRCGSSGIPWEDTKLLNFLIDSSECATDNISKVQQLLLANSEEIRSNEELKRDILSKVQEITAHTSSSISHFVSDLNIQSKRAERKKRLNFFFEGISYTPQKVKETLEPMKEFLKSEVNDAILKRKKDLLEKLLRALTNLPMFPRDEDGSIIFNKIMMEHFIEIIEGKSSGAVVLP